MLSNSDKGIVEIITSHDDAEIITQDLLSEFTTADDDKLYEALEDYHSAFSELWGAVYRLNKRAEELNTDD